MACEKGALEGAICAHAHMRSNPKSITYLTYFSCLWGKTDVGSLSGDWWAVIIKPSWLFQLQYTIYESQVLYLLKKISWVVAHHLGRSYREGTYNIEEHFSLQTGMRPNPLRVRADTVMVLTTVIISILIGNKIIELLDEGNTTIFNFRYISSSYYYCASYYDSGTRS